MLKAPRQLLQSGVRAVETMTASGMSFNVLQSRLALITAPGAPPPVAGAPSVTLRAVKAVVCRHYGPPKSLVVETPRPPTAGRGEVVLAAKPASINSPALLITRNQYQIKPPLPFVVGSEVVGTIKSIG